MELKAKVKAKKEEIRSFDRDYRAGRRRLDAELKALEQAVAAVAAPKRERRQGDLDAHKQAGPANIARMLEAFKDLGGRATAAAATQHAGYPAGHQVWAIRALEQDGLIRPTGEKENRSFVFEVVPQRKTTRVRPGETKAA